MEVPIGPALVFIFALGCVSAHDRFFISAPNVFHLGVKEKVFVQMGGSHLDRTVSLYLEDERNGRRMSDRVSTSCSKAVEIKTVELMINREKMSDLPAFKGTPYLMLVAESDSFPEINGRRVKQTRVLWSKHRGYIFIQTDQPIYTPVQKVRYRIFTLDHTMRPHQEPFHFSIINAAGNRLLKTSRLANGGILSDSFNIPDVSEMGTWKIEAHYEDDDSKSNIATREFKVQKFVMPSFEVNIQSEQSYVLLNAERLDFTITALYSFGKKVKGAYHSRVGVIIPGSDEGPKVKPVFIRGLEMTGSIQQGEARYNLSTAKLNEHLQNQVKQQLSDLEQSGAQLYMAVSVTDIYSGELQEADISFPIVSQRYTIDWSRTRSHFIPGVPLDVVVLVRQPNGSPADGVTVHINVSSVEMPHQAETDQRGAVFSTFNLASPTSNNNAVNVEVTVDGQQERKVIERAPSQSNSYLYMSISNNIHSVGEQLSVTYQVINGRPQDGTLYYMVISRGALVKHGSLTSGALSKHLLRITADMIPSFRVIGYYYHSNGDVVADSVWVDVKDECEGKLKVTSSQPDFKPGKRATFKIDLEGQRAKVALLAVDKAIYALKANNKLTAKQVFSSMMSYDLGCSYSGGSGLVSTLNDAGLAFLSPSTSESLQSKTRTGFGCESRPTRKSRSLDLRQAFQNLKSNYNDETLQKCCSSGLERIPMKRTCEERAQRVSRLNTRADGCTEAFLECCRQGQKLRERRRQEAAQRDFARTASESDIEEFFDQTSQEIRRHFPPSFEFTVLDVKGEKSHSLILPDSITTWEMQAVSLSATHGFCVAESYEFKVFKEVFVSLRLPYSVRRYEQIAIEPVIYNYLGEEVQIAVHMAQTPGLCSPGSATSTSFVNITVQPQSSQLVSFSAVPMETGEIPVKIRLYSITHEWGIDAIERMLKVSTEGIVEREEVGAKTVKLDGRSGSSIFTIDGGLPPETVPDSSSNIFIKMEGTGDGFGESTARTLLSPEGVSGLLRLPYGCAEQTMKMLAPTAISLRYLDVGQLWHQLPAGTRDKAFHTAEQGYMRILTFKKGDGSYGAWLHRPSSFWLTGLVVKVLSMVAARQTVRDAQGRRTWFVSPEEITLSARYLVSVQSADGSFNDPHPVLHREMQGGMGGKEQEASMTAFITIALKRSLEFIHSYNSSAEERRQVENSISRSTSYLLRNMDGLQRPYAVAMTAYCISICLPDSQDAAIAWKKLQKLATEPDKDGCRSWTASAEALNEEVLRTTWARTPSAEAVSVETTAYALLTAVARQDTAWAKSAACWLTSQENYGGGFKSTQDTLIALEALSEYDLSRTTPLEPTNMDIQFSVPGKSTVVNLALRNNNEKVETELKKLMGNKITMQLTGVGETKIRVVKVYHLMAPKDKCELLSIQVKVEGKVLYTAKIEENYDEYDDEDYQSEAGAVREEPVPSSAIEWFDARTRRRRDTQHSLSSLNAVDYEVCISYSLSRNLTGMAIADIRLLSGFEAQTTDLEKLKDMPEQYISHYEVNQGRVVLYFNELMNPTECITFGAVQRVPVGLLQPAPASVYDYYEPDRKCTVFYSAPHRSKMVSKLCSGDVCQCAERPCHKERSISGAQKPKELERQQHACYFPSVDYGFIVEVMNVSVKSNFELYTTRVLELLRANGDTLVKLSDTRVFAKRLMCKGKLVTGKQYLIMGKDGETTDSNGKMQYLLESNTWIEQRPGPTECKKSSLKRSCLWFNTFVSEYQTDGCRQ